MESVTLPERMAGGKRKAEPLAVDRFGVEPLIEGSRLRHAGAT